MKGEENYINGWHYITIYGSPSERGYAYGYFCAKEFCDIQKMLEYYIPETYGYSWDYFINWICETFQEMTKKRFPEIYQEMQGIVKGCLANGCNTSIEEIIAWNFYLSLSYWFSFKSDSHVGKEGGAKDHCSAFIAVGDWTATGEIVVGHNSFTDYIDGQYSNVVLHIIPDKGHQIIMQTSPCWIWSGTDFFITSAGIIGTETTIGGFQPYEERVPIGYRIRQAMQYANTLDDYVNMLIYENSGDYANSWLFGDIYTNEIMCLELGLKYHSISRTKNGYFIGFNATYDPRIRNLEVVNSGFYDIRRHQGARRVRLTELLIKNKGSLNCDIAKRILADHYDVYLKKFNPCSRTVCSHYDLDAREYMSQADRPKPFSPHGALDGVVCDSTLARKMGFFGRFGNSCGTAFRKDLFCKKHIQYSNFCPYLKDRPSQPWTLLSANITPFVNIKKTNYWKYANTYIVTETTTSIQPYSADMLVQYLEPDPSFIFKQVKRQTRRKRKHKSK
jgi:hypothetical protein